MAKLQKVRIVLSSPGDVGEERRIMQDVIDELNDYGAAAERGLRLELNRWETDAHPGIHIEGPQGLIDPILKIDECDILIGIFWKRFGTPTGKALSGTEHEIRTAIKCWEQSNRPEIMMYFKETKFFPNGKEEAEQLVRVMQFRDEFPKESLCCQFKDVTEFAKLTRRHLSNFIRSQYPPPGTVDEDGIQKDDKQDYIRDYCRRIQNRFSTMYLFGDQRLKVDDEEKALGHKASIEDAFVPLQLSDWREDNLGSDDVPLNIEDLFIDDGGENRFLVSGQPGGGKTTLMHYLTHRLASLAVEERRDRIPVYVRLHDFCCTEKTLEEFVQQQMNDECDSTKMYDMLCERGRFLEQSMVLLLDGLDEIEDHETNEKITGMLNEFAMEYPRCRIIITSRPLGLKSDDYSRYQFLKLLPLDEGMVDAYLDRWFDGDRGKIAKLQTTFNGRPRIRALAANPFLLSMICFTFEREGKTELVERRSQLYENCTRYLLERPYDDRKKSDRQFQYEEALSLLQELSLRFFLWQEADFSADHANVIGKLHPTATSLGKTDEFLDQLQQETGLIQRVKEGFTFVHRSLWEYFTALALLNKKKLEYVIRHAANPDWEEVVRLYAGLLSVDADIKKLVDGLWAINRPLALRVTTEIKAPAAGIIQPLIKQVDGNQGKLLLINSLRQTEPLIEESEWQCLVQETLNIMLLKCEESDCEVIYHAQILLEEIGSKPLNPGGIIYELLDLSNAAGRQEEFLNDPDNCFEWIQIQEGSFLMGDDSHGDDERPAHEVKISSFLMAKNPVTNRMLSHFPLGEKYSNYGGDRNPTVGNTWFEAYYCALWLDARLPTEAEWEYAARGGNNAQQTQYYFGDKAEELTQHAWFGESDTPHSHAVDEINPRTGRENLNPVGLANMHGNVYEWCTDRFGADYYKESPKENPKGPDKGSFRVIRGGSWGNDAQGCRSAIRGRSGPGYRNYYVGFRLSRSVSLDP